MSIPSPLRIPVVDRGFADDQRHAEAFLNWRQRNYWPFGGGQQPDTEFGVFVENSSYALYYRSQCEGRTVRAFRNPHTTSTSAPMYEPERWSTVAEFKPLPPVKPVPHWFFLIAARNKLVAERKTLANDALRWFDLPLGSDFEIPKPEEPQYADNGYMVDDDETGLTGIETLGLRRCSPVDVAVLNFMCGGQYVTEWDYIVDTLAVRTGNNTLDYKGQGSGKLPQRAGKLVPSDLIDGWDESKIVAYPNVEFGAGAKAHPGWRVEHPTLTTRHPQDFYPTGHHPTKMIMHGTCIAHTRPMEGPNGIKRWADDQGFTGDLKRSAIVNAVGCAEFGVTSGETGRGQAGIRSVGFNNPMHRDGFARAGVRTRADGWSLMRGLFTPDTTIVVNPAVLDKAHIR